MVGCKAADTLPREQLDHAQATTGADGRASLTMDGGSAGAAPLQFDVVVQAADNGAPLSEVQVTALGDADDIVVIARPPGPTHRMEIGAFTRAEVAEIAESRDFGLTAGAVLLTLAALEFVDALLTVERQDPPLLWASGNYSVVCLTRDQFEDQQQLGRSFVFLTTDLLLAGHGSHTLESAWELAESTGFADLAASLLLEEYGEHDEYVVTVPNTPTVLDALGDDDMLVGDVSLLTTVIEEAPVWGVAGNDCGAFVDGLSGGSGDGNDDDDDDDDDDDGPVCQPSDLLCDEFGGSTLDPSIWEDVSDSEETGGVLLQDGFLSFRSEQVGVASIESYAFPTEFVGSIEIAARWNQGPSARVRDRDVIPDQSDWNVSGWFDNLFVDCDGDSTGPVEPVLLADDILTPGAYHVVRATFVEGSTSYGRLASVWLDGTPIVTDRPCWVLRPEDRSGAAALRLSHVYGPDTGAPGPSGEIDYVRIWE